MRVSVTGCGYLGAVHAACMAALGHDVVGYDIQPRSVEALSRGEAPFYEPGLDELLGEGIRSGRLKFSDDPASLAGSQVHFICVGTPQEAEGRAADLSFVNSAVDHLIPHLSPGDVVVGKSTVPVGTAAPIARRFSEAVPGTTLVWNPEFLREGFAIEDTMHPNRLVYGSDAGSLGSDATAALDSVYSSILASGVPRILTDFPTAELVKVAANSFLATKISFINAMAELCEVAGADVTQLADAIGHDDRIGRKFLNAGLGFGGGCLPKDIRAFMARAEELGVDQALDFLREVDAINDRRRGRMVTLAHEELDGEIENKKIAVLGAAFKPNSDDVRDSPALDVALKLLDQGAIVTVTDPKAIANAKRKFPALNYAATADEAVKDADLVLVLTEWQEFKEIDPVDMAPMVHRQRILDGRNCLDPISWRKAGWTYRALGRT